MHSGSEAITQALYLRNTNRFEPECCRLIQKDYYLSDTGT